MVNRGFPSDEEVERQTYLEFLDEARDVASTMQVLLENMRTGVVKPAESIVNLRRHAHNLKTAGHAVNSPLIRLITHRLEEYLSELKRVTSAQVAEIQVFLDRIQAVVDGETADEAEVMAVVRSLPAKRRADIDFGSIEQKNVEVLLIVPEKAMSHIIERELAACGYRVSNVHDPFHALEMIVRIKPDMVIAAMELGTVISGIDLGCALAAMTPTQSVPYSLLTSYEWGHAKLRGLPARAALIRKGPKFGDDLAEFLARFNIT